MPRALKASPVQKIPKAPAGQAKLPKAAEPVGKGPLPAANVAAIFNTLQRANPTPRTELHYTDAFTLLVAVALAAQSTDAGVNLATPALFKTAPTPARMAALGEAKIKQLIATIGLYNTKARNVLALSTQLVRDHGGQVPRDREALEALPGVGRKTANVVLNVIWGEPTMAVDTHVFRVSNRTGLANGANPRAVEDKLVRVIPAEFMQHAHHWLVLHGRYICMAKKPRCAICPIYDWCRWPNRRATAAAQGGRDAA